LRDQNANDEENGHESQPGQLDQDDEIKPPPHALQQIEPGRRTQAAFILWRQFHLRR
jgi:hypothetical protein